MAAPSARSRGSRRTLWKRVTARDTGPSRRVQGRVLNSMIPRDQASAGDLLACVATMTPAADEASTLVSLCSSSRVVLAAQSGQAVAVARLLSEDGVWIEATDFERLVLESSVCMRACGHAQTISTKYSRHMRAGVSISHHRLIQAGRDQPLHACRTRAQPQVGRSDGAPPRTRW